MSLAAAAVLAEGAAEHHREFQFAPWVYGVGALVAFLVLLFVITRFDPDR